MTYGEFLQTEQARGLFDGLSYDETDQERLAEWFYDRRVCSNDRFFRIFRSRLRLVEGNYNNYKRVETIEFDPLVTDYVEREHKNQGTTQSQEAQQGTSSSEHNNEGTNHNTLVHGLKVLTINNLVDESAGEGTSERNDRAVNNSVTKHGGEDTTDTHGSTGESALEGSTPQSQTYQQAAPGEMPVLNWLYTSGQRQTQSNRSENSITKHGGEDTTDETRSTRAQGREVTKRRDTSTGTVEVQNSGEDDTIQNTTDKGRVTSSDTSSSRGETASKTLDRERSSGRHESAQDLLTRAREYVINTDSFEWLVGQLDSCFRQLYD